MIIRILIIMILIATLLAIRIITKNKKNKNECSAQQFMNIDNLDNSFLFTKDQTIITYLKIEPISIELLSENEKQQISSILTAELAIMNRPFKLLSVSRPVDVSNLIEEYRDDLKITDDPIRRELLRKEMYEMSSYALSGEVVERQFYLQIWEKVEDNAERKLHDNIREIKKAFESVQIKSNILNKNEIVELLCLINNGVYEEGVIC